MNSKDFDKIKEYGKSGGYKGKKSSIFNVPRDEYYWLQRNTEYGIDWAHLMKDLINGILEKLGNIADEWYFMFDIDLGYVAVSHPCLLYTSDAADE